MAPGFKPRKLYEIIDKLKTYFNKSTSKYIETQITITQLPDNHWVYSYPMMTEEEIYNLVINAPNEIAEIQELNLSNNEFNKGITLDNPDRFQYNFVGIDIKSEEDNDFIDIDALTRNVFNKLFYNISEEYKFFYNENN